MKGAGTLALLVGFAAAAAVLLVLTRPEVGPTAPPPPAALAPELYLQSVLGLNFTQSPVIETVSQEILRKEIEANLEEQFGPGGLMRRTRALELLGFADFARRNLRDEMIAWQAGGVRGWFDDRNGRILLPGDFDESRIHDRVVLHGLLARLLVHQHTPPTIGKLPDDEWIARTALHTAIAESVEARLRAENRAAFEIPTTAQTEREAILLALPIYLHQIANLPLQQGEARIFLETRLQTGVRTLTALVDDPPRSTLEFLNGDPSALSPPRLPAPPENAQVQLEESMGAFALQALLEWIDNYEQAQALAPLWRGDRYRLFATASGDHVLWLCRWETTAAATRAAEILASQPPAEGTRHCFARAEGRVTILANCADAQTLDQLSEIPPP